MDQYTKDEFRRAPGYLMQKIVGGIRQRAPGALIGAIAGFAALAFLASSSPLWMGVAIMGAVGGAYVGMKTLGDLSFLTKRRHGKSENKEEGNKSPALEQAPSLEQSKERQRAREASIKQMDLEAQQRADNFQTNRVLEQRATIPTPTVIR